VLLDVMLLIRVVPSFDVPFEEVVVDDVEVVVVDVEDVFDGDYNDD